MSDPINFQPRKIGESSSINPAADVKRSPATIDARVLAKVELTIVEKPDMNEILQAMAKVADFLAQFSGQALACRVVSPLNSSMQGMLQASATLTKAAMDQIQEINQMKAQEQARMGGGLVGPGGAGGPGGPGGPGYRN